MGHDATNYLPDETREADLDEFLHLLGYNRTSRRAYLLFRENGYRHLSGVGARVSDSEHNGLQLHTRTSAWVLRGDIEDQNRTIRQVRKRFGGYFESDEGRGRYFRPPDVDRRDAEAGCYIAYFQLQNSLSTANVYLAYLDGSPDKWPALRSISALADRDPQIVAANLFYTYLVSIFEEFTRALYVALLTYSARKANVFKAARIVTDDLVAASEGRTSLEAAVARKVSFQNIELTLQAFRELDSTLDMRRDLTKPYRRRRETLLTAVARIQQVRHAVVHRNQIDIYYDLRRARADLATVNAAIERIYVGVARHYGWRVERL